MTLLVACAVVFAGICFVYIARLWSARQIYVKRINAIPGPRSFPLIGTTYELFAVKRHELPAVLQRQCDEFPRISRSWMGPMGQVHLSRAEDMEVALGSGKQHMSKSWSYGFLHPWLGRGLLTSYGERWRHHRKVITPTFHFGILDSFCEVFAEKSNILVQKLNEFADGSGQSVDVYPFVTRAALDIISEAAMGTMVNAQDDPNNAYVHSVYITAELLLRRSLRPWLYSDMLYALTDDGKRAAKHLNILHRFSKDVIAKRKQLRQINETNNNLPKKRLAFLDLLLENSETLSDSDIREEVDTFMFEGHDTTTAAIVWALLLLGLHPDIQEQVHDELEHIFHGSDRPATLSDYSEMHLLDRVIKETLRLYPSVPNIGREISEDVQIGQYLVPKGTTAVIELVHLHQDERYFPDHRRFDPDRFLPENTVGRHPYAYLPFSAGPRNCIGQKFAVLEEKAVISSLVRNFKWSSAVRDRHEVVYVYELIMRPISGIPLIFERR